MTPRSVFTGILHVHSNFSYDGVHSVDELAAFGRACGYDFMAMSEHSDTLDQETMGVYVQECQRVSGGDFVMIPGIEFTCTGNLHVVGLGVPTYTALTNPVSVAEFVRERGGVPVVAHPSRYSYRIASSLAPVLGGIEIWNASYDGRFAPDNASLSLLEEFRKRNESLLAFAGQDLHRVTARRCRVSLTVRAPRLTGDAIVGGLRNGDFVISNGLFRLHARRQPGPLTVRRIVATRAMYHGAKRLRDALGKSVYAARGLIGARTR